MTDEDAQYYAEKLSPAETAVILGCRADDWRLIEVIADESRLDKGDVGRAAKALVSMNLIERQQSRLAGQFFQSTGKLNDRGERVQQFVRAMNKDHNAPNQ